MLIVLFEVPATADASFIAAWGGFGTLHRALRPDVDFRFAELARVDAGAAPVPRDDVAAHAALYEVVHQDGQPEGQGGVVLIEPFEVPAEADDEFRASWSRTRNGLARAQGYLGTRLYRSAEPADFRFVDVARWSSPLMVARAFARGDPEEAAAQMPFASHPALYTVVRADAGAAATRRS